MRRPPIDGLLPKNLVGIPWRVAFALQADGWYLRSDIIWAKPNPMPESVIDRPTKSHEYVFLFSKSQKYYYDAKSIKEIAKEKDFESRYERAKQHHKSMPTNERAGIRPRHTNKEEYLSLLKHDHSGTRNKRDVWTVCTQCYSEAHFATFPPDLIKPMILAGCPAGGTVLDPFLGSGTTAYVSKELCRCCVGIELNPKYTKLAEKRLIQEVINFNQDAGVAPRRADKQRSREKYVDKKESIIE
jgi:DNA modification methylase